MSPIWITSCLVILWKASDSPLWTRSVISLCADIYVVVCCSCFLCHWPVLQYLASSQCERSLTHWSLCYLWLIQPPCREQHFLLAVVNQLLLHGAQTAGWKYCTTLLFTWYQSIDTVLDHMPRTCSRYSDSSCVSITVFFSTVLICRFFHSTKWSTQAVIFVKSHVAGHNSHNISNTDENYVAFLLCIIFRVIFCQTIILDLHFKWSRDPTSGYKVFPLHICDITLQ